MHKALVLAAGLALVSSAALAQSNYDSTSSSSRSGGGYGSDSSDWRGGHGWNRDDNDRHHGWHHRMASSDSADRDDDQDQEGARFRVRNGDMSVAVRCDGGESMRACVDATVMLVEKLKGLQTGSTSSTGTSAAPGSSSPTPPTPPAPKP